MGIFTKKKEKEKNCVVVPIGWFESLARMSEELEHALAENDTYNLLTFKASQIAGYTSTAKHIIESNPRVTYPL